MKKKDAILGGVSLALVLTLIATAFLASVLSVLWKPEAAKAETWKADTYAAVLTAVFTAVSAAGLVFVGIYTVKSAEKVATTQKNFLEKMEYQKNKPYCDFIIVKQTSTSKSPGIYLKNFGHGPALNMKWKLIWAGKPVAQEGRNGMIWIISQYENLDNQLEGMFPNYIASNSEENLFRLRDLKKNENPDSFGWGLVKADFYHLINHLDIKVTFISMLGNEETKTLSDTIKEHI